ncbi:MAG: D-alanyl-D-alanine carboxypeptidase/D-alanyl-D-alanine-endopeptidase [Parachlamydiaceae bacterium]|nr:D-alanyl-D-alanine carboxypeptidase/D-alanyl-D-alanine-endopeptidase [Parachlamydiaceae bacterium]
MLSIRQIICLITLLTTTLQAELPEMMQRMMNQKKYEHSTWGVYFKDTTNGEILHELNSNQMFLPASTTKLFTVASLLHAYGDTYRFKTPVFAVGDVNNGVLKGNLVLVGQGDLIFGGRFENSDTVAFTNLDHINANELPEVTLTPQDPLYAFIEIAKELRLKGIRQIDGEVLIDERLFETVEKRGVVEAPVFINENLIDMVLNPTQPGQEAKMTWRPQAEGYSVVNKVVTVADGKTEIQIQSDAWGRQIILKGTIAANEKDLVRTTPIKDPAHFARVALIKALRDQGIVLNPPSNPAVLPSEEELKQLQPMATWTSAPLSEYAKLILKVSHNVGADLVPLLLAAQKGKKTFDEGMLLIGDFVVNVAKVSPGTFVFVDAAGADSNRLTPQAEIQLLDYIRQLPKESFQKFYNALPILGVDGSLADFGKDTPNVGKVRAKPGTGMLYNQATGTFFLTTQALTGFLEAENGHLIEFMLVVNNASAPKVEDVLAIFGDVLP